MEREVLAEMVEQGLTIAEMARRLNRHPSTIAYWLKRHGLKGAGRRTNVPKGSLRREELEQLVEADLPVREIAKRVGRSYSTVRYWLERYGLETTARARSAWGRAAAQRTTGVCVRHGSVEYVHTSRGPICTRCRAEGVTEWRRRAKRLLVDEAGGGCAICGYERCLQALHFHHVDPSRKSFALGGRGLARSIHDLRAEAAKCVLLCSNCHAEVEAGLVELPHYHARPARPPGSLNDGPG